MFVFEFLVFYLYFIITYYYFFKLKFLGQYLQVQVHRRRQAHFGREENVVSRFRRKLSLLQRKPTTNRKQLFVEQQSLFKKFWFVIVISRKIEFRFRIKSPTSARSHRPDQRLRSFAGKIRNRKQFDSWRSKTMTKQFSLSFAIKHFSTNRMSVSACTLSDCSFVLEN